VEASGSKEDTLFPLIFEALAAIGYQGYVTVHQAFAEILPPREAAEQNYACLTSIADFEPREGADR